MFTIEVGRRSISGPGTFHFKHDAASLIMDTTKRARDGFTSRHHKGSNISTKIKNQPLLPLPHASAQGDDEGLYSQPYGHMPDLKERWGLMPDYANSPVNRPAASLQVEDSDLYDSIDELNLKPENAVATPGYLDMTGQKNKGIGDTKGIPGYIDMAVKECKTGK